MAGREENIINLDQIIDERSFELIYNLHWKKVYGICLNNVKDVNIAQEMVQDIFKSLWERKDTLILQSPVDHYLVRAAKLKVFEHIRNKTIREKHLDCALQDYCGSTNCTDNQIIYNDLKSKVDLLVDKLSCQCREVYKLKERGFTNREIASKLLISEKAVEYHVTKAFSFLRKNLTEYSE